jgi:hypothetical protein
MVVVRRWYHSGRQPLRGPKADLPKPTLMKDIEPFISPVGVTNGQPGELITSRSELRAHERKHGVKQCGELKSASDFDCAEKIPDFNDGVQVKVEWADYKENFD